MCRHRITVAPMMGYSDRHFRRLIRIMSRRAFLYTEMVTPGEVFHNPLKKVAAFSQEERPLALQLGSSSPKELAECSKIAEDLGYDEVNLNVGCPSHRVQMGQFGACLMKDSDLVADCISNMHAQTTLPVTVKTRIGVDEYDDYEFLYRFIKHVSEAGCQIFIVHARKAWLEGLSPKENRHVPPLSYSTVYRLQKDFPHLTFVINGGIKTVENINAHLSKVSGVMIGRAAYENPFLFASMDHLYFDTDGVRTKSEILLAYLAYMENEFVKGEKLPRMTRHMMGLLKGKPCASWLRQQLTEAANANDINRVRQLMQMAAQEA